MAILFSRGSVMSFQGRVAALLKPKFAKVLRTGLRPKNILDIGIANNSYQECKRVFPSSIYHGVDYIDRSVVMRDGDRFFQVNLEESNSLADFEPGYDLILVNHVLEHLQRGSEVYAELSRLLAPGGLMYVEFPSIRTAYRAKRRGSYHFHDDPSHIKFYVLEELANSAISNQCQVVSCGPASTWMKDLASLPRAVIGFFLRGSWGAYLIHLQRRIDHVLIRRSGTLKSTLIESISLND
jgi:predicted SAM-dependent methyltransferase